MKTRNLKKIITDVSPAQFEEAMANYAAAENREAEIAKSIEAEINEVRENYEDELLCLAQGKSTAFETVRCYCLNNKDSLFAKRRSIGTLSGIAGFRLGTPHLKTAKGSNWNIVFDELKNKLPEYIRTTKEPAKDLLLADSSKENVAPVLVELGIQVVQDELFYIEAKRAA